MRVTCNVRSAQETRKISGYIVRECNNRGIFEVRLDHSIFFKGAILPFNAGDIILVTESEIEKS
jgi:hypothetical protein